MLETMLITFREGLEAFLIVAITIAYLVKTGRRHLLAPVYAGVVAALLASIAGSVYLSELAASEVTEGLLALVAGALVASMTWYVMKAARHFRSDIHERIEQSAARDGKAAMAGIFSFTVLMIAREGMETALMLGSIAGSAGAAEMLAGAAAGLVLALTIGLLWVRHSSKINLRLFLQTTGVFLILFSTHLFVYGIHELSEASALPLGTELNYSIHLVTEPFGHDALPAALITYGLIALPCAWLIWVYARERLLTPGKASAAAE